MRKVFLALPVLLALGAAAHVASAQYPRLRAERILFGALLLPLQHAAGLIVREDRSLFYGFAFEDPAVLQPLREAFELDRVAADAPIDLDRHIALMHWVRDRFPHGVPKVPPDPDAFDGLAVLRAHSGGGYLCGTAAQLLVQAISSLGGRARRVDLRFTPADSHVVTEAWSERWRKWIVLDPDYDVYFTVADVPQSAIELHRLWAAGRVGDVEVHWRASPHNIYKSEHESDNASFIRTIYESRDFARWDRERAQHPFARFAVKLLNYYTHISYPLRNDWLSRPLPWWHPQGNHVQNSLVIALQTMPAWEDFLLTIPGPGPFYAAP